jgi:outer membrane lipoprotein LolB
VKVRLAALLLILVTFFGLVGCASPSRIAAENGVPITSWSGRLAVRVDATAALGPQAFSAFFELQGTPEQGQLRFFTPLGSTAAVIAWSPGQAQLQSGDEIQHFSNIAELTEHLLGTPMPLSALFAWLAGDSSSLDGWQVDQSQFDSGKIVAQRVNPAPRAEIRVLLEP